MAFSGFPKGTVTFLRELKANNSKDWFQAHRSDYDNYYVAPALGLIETLAPIAAKLNPPLQAVAKTNGSLRRIHRDVRFSKDKTPYNTHLHLVFWAGGHPNRSSGIHLVMGHDGFGYGAGHWAFEPAVLERYRAAVLDAKKRAKLEKALAGAEEIGCTLDEPPLKNVPRGFDKEAPGAEYLRYKGIVARTQDGRREFDPRLFTAGCVGYCTELMNAMVPLVRWIREEVETD